MGVAFGVALALTATVLAVVGSDANGTRVALRLTARWSFLLFWAAYAGGAMAALFGPALLPLARRGRELGLAFAAAQSVHLGLVVWLYWITGRPPLSGWLLVFFAAGVVWTYLLAAFSIRTLSEILGSERWRLLRVLGMNYILLAFARDFVLPAMHSGVAHQNVWRLVEYGPFAAMCVAAPFLRFAAALHRRPGGWHVAAVPTRGAHSERS